MKYLVLETETTATMIEKMNSKTVAILKYLFDIAKENNNIIELKYKDIEEALKIGHTCVGDSMRLLLSLNIIKKTGFGQYCLNSEIINECSATRTF